jgi:hypothetical protein
VLPMGGTMPTVEGGTAAGFGGAGLLAGAGGADVAGFITGEPWLAMGVATLEPDDVAEPLPAVWLGGVPDPAMGVSSFA